MSVDNLNEYFEKNGYLGNTVYDAAGSAFDIGKVCMLGNLRK